MLFYTVDITAQVFQQLHRATVPAQASQATKAPSLATEIWDHGSWLSASAPSPEPRAPSPQPALAQFTLPMSLFLSASVVGVAVMLVVIGLVYFTAMNRHARGVTGQQSALTAAAPKSPSSSGIMRGSRWQILPGGVGGFSSSANPESHR